jgi:hypothetical protein
MTTIINTNFNTIATIADSSFTSSMQKRQAYLNACDEFEKQASDYAHNESFMSRKSAEEVSFSYNIAKGCECEYSLYRAALACEVWLSKAWNNAD